MSVPRPEHIPVGNPCNQCGLAAERHRKRVRGEHTPIGNPCSKCGLLADQHRQRDRYRSDYFKAWRQTHLKAEREIIAIDGEGYTVDGAHLYTYMAAATGNRLVGDIENLGGLTTTEVFDFLLSLPIDALKVGFSLGYDITKWIEDMPNGAIWALSHPEERQGKRGPRAVHWKHYWINRVSSRFSIKTEARRTVVWDLFKFYQKAFVKAMEDWEVATKKERDEIQAMKDQRGKFAGILQEEKAYCQSECRFMADMAEKLIVAHDDASLPLKSYYGPGSTASVMLDHMGAKDQIATIPDEMWEAVDCAYAGGRFEHSSAGPFWGTLYEDFLTEKLKLLAGSIVAHGADIASAYPYAFFRLPCMQHGKWERVTERMYLQEEIEQAPAACVRYTLPSYDGLPSLDLKLRDDLMVRRYIAVKGKAALLPWGPFPYRCPDGNILFPVVSPGGWVWSDEFLTAQRWFPNVEAVEAWVLRQSCNCGCPFAEKIANYYNLRLEWGKEGRGIVVKNGINSCYGKRAQRAGIGPYRCLVAAGIITSMTRAMLLDATFSISNPWNVGALSTDGIVARERLALPTPIHTGTEDMARKYGKLPLGAWEYKPVSGGVQLIRPGIRFPLDFEEEEKEAMKNTAARGLGTKVLYQNRRNMLEEWKRAPMQDIAIQQPDMFMGAKVSITRRKDGSFTRHHKYGKWERPDPRKVSYMSLPKRPTCLGASDGYRLTTWVLDDDMGMSRAYSRTPRSDLARQAAELKTLEWEQPDQDKLFSY